MVPERSGERDLAGSTDMAPVEGTVDVRIPVSTLWEAFSRADLWPRWNRCMLWVRNRDLVRDRRLLWAFRPIRWWYPYVLPAIARIVEVKDKRRVTWEVTALPGFYARHTYHMKDLGGGRTRFGSWEKAMGRGFRLMRWFWVPHFVFVKDRSLEGVRLLEEAYLREGKIEESTLPGGRRARMPLLLLLPLLAGATALVLAARAPQRRDGGPLFFNGHYPFLDRNEGVASIPRLIQVLRHLADTYPEAVFLPGHGPLARAGYLRAVTRNTWRLSEVGPVDPAVFPRRHAHWAAANNNVRWAYQMSKGKSGS